MGARKGAGGSFNITSEDLLKKKPRIRDFRGSIFKAFHYLLFSIILKIQVKKPTKQVN